MIDLVTNNGALFIVGICLLGMVAALIFSNEFRDDILKVEGKTTFFRLFSVEGALFLALAALFIGALIFFTNQKSQIDNNLKVKPPDDWFVVDKHTGVPSNLYINDSLVYQKDIHDLSFLNLKITRVDNRWYLTTCETEFEVIKKIASDELVENGLFSYIELEDKRDITILEYQLFFQPVFSFKRTSLKPSHLPIRIVFDINEQSNEVFYNIYDTCHVKLNNREGYFDEPNRMPEIIYYEGVFYYIEVVSADFLDPENKHAKIRIIELKPKI